MSSGVDRCSFDHQRERLIGAAVVDEHHFVWPTVNLVEHGLQTLEQFGKDLRFVVEGDGDRYARRIHVASARPLK